MRQLIAVSSIDCMMYVWGANIIRKRRCMLVYFPRMRHTETNNLSSVTGNNWNWIYDFSWSWCLKQYWSINSDCLQVIIIVHRENWILNCHEQYIKRSKQLVAANFLCAIVQSSNNFLHGTNVFMQSNAWVNFVFQGM